MTWIFRGRGEVLPRIGKGRDVEDLGAPRSLVDERYRIESPLGQGGMGVVYRATDLRLDRPVAIKFLAQTAEADAPRFRTEVRALARLVHPNLVRLLDAGEDDGRLYLVMDLIEGESL